MIKIVLISLFLLLGFLSKAQDFQGKAEYFSKRILNTNVEKIEKNINKDTNPEFEKAFQDALNRATEKKYLLTFTKFECLYEEQQELDTPKAPSSGMAILVSFSEAGKKYINIKDKNSIVEDEIFGKEFLIIEPLEKPDWKLVDETKKIGEYNCFRAELLIPVSEKQRKEYEEFLKKEETKPALFKMEEPKDEVIIAWYTPEIPLSFGPNNYWGLPGLILEINEDKTIILCSKVTLNNKEKSKIKAPNTGEKVTQKKFDAIQKNKTDNMKDEDGNIIFQTTD
jgi:GLPGLI family protein